MTERRRNLLVLLLVAGLLAASAVAILVRPTRLGLDLKGGIELVYQGRPSAQQPTVTQEALDRAVDIIRERVNQLGVSEAEVQTSGRDQLDVGLPSVSNLARAEKQVGSPAQLAFYDWERNILGPNLKPLASEETASPATISQWTNSTPGGPANALPLYRAVKLASRRKPIHDGNNFRRGPQYWLFGPGRHGPHTLLAGPDESARDLLSELTPPVRPPGSEVVTVPEGTIVLQAQTSRSLSGTVKPEQAPWYVLNDDVALLGKDLKNPRQEFQPPDNTEPVVAFDFTGKGNRLYHDLTRTVADRGNTLHLVYPQFPLQADDFRQTDQHTAIALDNKIISVAYISSQKFPDGIDPTGTGAEISGGFKLAEAQDLANLLRLGALPIDLKLISESQVSATLGRQALHEGLIAGAVGLALVAIFLLVFYRLLGLIAIGGLAVYGAYLFALIKLVPITLTLPGIAGLILTIGVAADANIVIFERVKEEVRAGRSVRAAIAAGYKKGLSAIIDANVVTIMTAFILFLLATSGVKGFAFTLGVGTIVSLFTAVMATQAILASIGHSRAFATPAALGVGRRSHRVRFDFMGNSRWFFSMSGVILLVGAVAIGGRGLNFGIDFESGTRINTALVKPADEGRVRGVMTGLGYPDAKIQRLKNKDLGPNAFQISTKTIQPSAVVRVKNALDRRFGVAQGKFSNTSVGPTFGQTVARSAVIAIIASLLVISAYIALRFEFKFAVPVLIALMHDLLITAGVYSLTGREVTSATVAALLTILGYSLYDTIIVFDRVRENVPRMPRAAFSQIVNRSMSEVLTRSLATSLSTLLPILSLLLFGGATLKDFAFALLVGVASGAYSSIFIASPVLTHWKEREPVYAARRRRIAAEHGGAVPAYAGRGSDVAPAERRARRPAPLGAEPGEVSREEFEELKRGIDVEEPAPARTRTRPAPAPPRAPRPPAASDGHAPDEPENDGLVQRPDRPASRGSRRPRNRRHGRNR